MYKLNQKINFPQNVSKIDSKTGVVTIDLFYIFVIYRYTYVFGNTTAIYIEFLRVPLPALFGLSPLYL